MNENDNSSNFSESTGNEIITNKNPDKILNKFIEKNNSESLLSYLSQMSPQKILELKFGQNSKTIIHKLIILDIQTLFFQTFFFIQKKLSKDELKNLINMQDNEGNTALLYACFKGNFQIVKCLIENGADPNQRNYMGLNVLHMSSQGDRPNLLIYFKDKYHFNINQTDFEGNSPLHWACHTNAENSINFLLSWMDNINLLNKKNQTPLHIAIYNLRPKIIKKLLHKGADINIKDNTNHSVFDIVSNNEKNIPEFNSIFRIITDFKPMKACMYNKQTFLESKKNNKNLSFIMFIIIHILCEFLIYFSILPYLNSFILDKIFYILVFLLFLLFIIISQKDPGIVHCLDKNITWLELIEKNIYINDYCPYCKILKTVKIKHCHICKKCIDGFDHHCNWIDNCVGEKNSALFMIFVFVTIINLGFSYYVSLKCFLIDDGNSNDIYYSVFMFSWFYYFTIKDMISIFIMTICIIFIIPVCYVLWIQIINGIFHINKKNTIKN